MSAMLEQLRKAIAQGVGPEKSVIIYRKMRQRQAELSTREHKQVKGQGAADNYPGGYPL